MSDTRGRLALSTKPCAFYVNYITWPVRPPPARPEVVNVSQTAVEEMFHFRDGYYIDFWPVFLAFRPHQTTE